MIDWYCRAFGFEIRLKVEGDRGQIEHSELTYGDGMIFVARERAGGADYWADRSYGAVDPEGHLWWFTQRIRDPKP